MQAPITYFGGKSLQLDRLFKLFPLSYGSYIEPFGGAFSVGLNQPLPVPEIYNDMEQNIYSLYKAISDKELFEELRGRLEICVYSERMRQESLDALKTELSLADRAFHFFYSSRTSRNGHGGFGYTICPRRSMSKSVSSFLGAVDGLEELHRRMSRVTVLNRDGVGLIEEYGQVENAFIFMDPPYDQSMRGSARYKVDMNREQQIRFLETVKDIKAQGLICGYDSDLYNDALGSKWSREDFVVKTQTCGNESKTKTESVWRNYGKTGMVFL
jgi:DNA adenine methylase